MKSFESHVAAMSRAAALSDDLDVEISEPAADDVHPLAAELRAIIEKRGTATIGTYADLVNRLMGELTMAEQHLSTAAPVGTQRPGPTRTHAPMTEEQEQRIVDWFAARNAEIPWSHLR